MKTYIIGLALAAALSVPAVAKDALCYSTDDGEYPCDFKSLDADGSFEVSAEGMPTFQLWISEPGQGFVNAMFGVGSRAVALPGTYYRSEDDSACWISDETDAELCAW